MAYTLPALNYDYNALEPHFDAQTMEIHHSKHHNAYVTKLNAAIESAGIDAPECVWSLIANISALPQNIQAAVRNNGGGHANHSYFWKHISSQGGGEPTGELGEAITKAFGSFDAFKEQFSTAAANRFGSGWAWLAVKEDKSLTVCSTANQDNPYMAKGLDCSLLPDYGYPVIGLDVWEHAYYLKYQNRRPDYIQAFWNVVDWKQASENYKAGLEG